MKTNYNLKQTDKAKIETIIEEFYQNRINLADKLINWESVTLQLDFPLPNDELDHKNWVNCRPKWIQSYNKAFVKAKYPCHLEVERGLGVYLLNNGAVVLKKVSKRGRKIKNDLNTTVRIFDELINCFPKERKPLTLYKSLSMNMMYSISGMIYNSNLSEDLKMAFLGEFNKGLPVANEV